jgi:hypothetical protein
VSSNRHRRLADPAYSIEVVAVWVLLGGWFASLSILGWQAFTRLKFGYWPPLPVMVPGYVQLEWVRRLLDSFPLSPFVFFVFTGLLFSVANRRR